VLADSSPRLVFLVGVLPALLVFWIRRAVPETDEWVAAKIKAPKDAPGIALLFRGEARRTAVLVILVCSSSLTAHWAFIFWYQQHLRNLPDVVSLTAARKNEIASIANWLVMSAAILGNFLAAAMAKVMGYRRAIALLCLAYFLSMTVTYSVPRSHTVLLFLLPVMGASGGLFALFTMYLPPLFPVLLRTTGSGFCYNIGRIAAAAGTVVFGLFTKVGDYRFALICAGALFLPAAFIAWWLPDLPSRGDQPEAASA
jgi:predicted MFS family arabinose efflux permease